MGSHLGGSRLPDHPTGGLPSDEAEWNWFSEAIPQVSKFFGSLFQEPQPGEVLPEEKDHGMGKVVETPPKPGLEIDGAVSRMSPRLASEATALVPAAKKVMTPPPPPPPPGTSQAPLGFTKPEPTGSPAFRSRRIDVKDTDAGKHDSVEWSEGQKTGGQHLHADVLGYSATDYLHSREQLVSLIERGLKPPPSLFTQLEACAHKMSESDLRDEYMWFVSTYLDEASSPHLKGACEMLVIRLGEIVSLPLAARLAKKSTDTRLRESMVTPRAPMVVDTDMDTGSGGADYEAYVEKRSDVLERRRKGQVVERDAYAEIDLRMYTLPGADMIVEYKYLAGLYLDYEFSEVPGEIKVRGFVELRLMRLGELLYMPLQLRVAAVRADIVLSKLDKSLPSIVNSAMTRVDEVLVDPAARAAAVPPGLGAAGPPGLAQTQAELDDLANMAKILAPSGKPEVTAAPARPHTPVRDCRPPPRRPRAAAHLPPYVISRDLA